MTEEKKTVEASNKPTPKKAARPWLVFLEWTQVLAAILSLLATIVAGIGSDLLSSRLVSALPSQYLTALVIILSAGIGLGTVFYLAVSLYQRQVRQRQLLLDNLVQKEKDFFQIIETDITTLLEEGGR